MSPRISFSGMYLEFILRISKKLNCPCQKDAKNKNLLAEVLLGMQYKSIKCLIHPLLTV